MRRFAPAATGRFGSPPRRPLNGAGSALAPPQFTGPTEVAVPPLPSAPMIRGEQSTEIDASPEAVFAIASDLERYPEWQDFLQRVTARERDPDGRPTLVDAEADAKVTKLQLKLRATRDEPRRV